MKPTTLTALLGASATATVCAGSAIPIAAEPPASRSNSNTDRRIPSSYESAVMGRRILSLTPLGTLATIFPEDSSDETDTQERRPPSVAGQPHSLMEYISDCESNSKGNPTLLAISIATSFRNIAAGSNVSLAVQWTPPHPPAKRIQSSPLTEKILSFFRPTSSDSSDSKDETYDPLPYSAANLPRFSLLGHIERISEEQIETDEIAKCYTKIHPDARYWLPGNRIHRSYFVRLVVDQIYWVGGFGDRAFIGWIPVEEWNRVTREEWEAVRLPGEKKGWKEWSLGGGEDL
ncbi:Pyridoxamine 5'-phosphate oxidase domain containing protein [Naviculisporaceae sp. PSN 640]